MSAFEAAVERLRGDLPAALGRAITADDAIAVAVSGGPDSMALLALAAAGWPGQVIAATVDHGLRAAGADEAAMVAAWCADDPLPFRHPGLVPGSTVARTNRPEDTRDSGPRNKSGVTMGGQGVSHTTIRPSSPLSTSNLQATARTARYALLGDWAVASGATMLLTAHHADDQAETFLMRASRGSGLAGLSGIRPRRDLTLQKAQAGYPQGGVVAVYDERTIPLVRPLLGWRRSDLRDIVIANGIPFVDDPSNADDHYDRTRFRALLNENHWLDPRHLAKTAAYACEGHDALEAMIDWLWKERQAVPPDADDQEYQTWLDLAGLPREIKRRLAREAIASVRNVNGITRPAFSRASNIEPLLDAVEAGKAATHAGILVSRARDVWHFREAPPRRDALAAHS